MILEIVRKTSEVFGVSNEAIETYVERELVDNLFVEGLTRNKHIIVYGASKQGKTSLANKHLLPQEFIRVNCSYDSSPVDLYMSVLRQLKIEFETSKEEVTSSDEDSSMGMKATVKIPCFGSVEVEGDMNKNTGKKTTKNYKNVEYNLGLAQDISEILGAINFDRRVILENFHYLNEDAQKKLSYDLRIFEDYNILFIILGIWREKNRLGQFNGDLLDRVIEVPVEPWRKSDLKRIIDQGEPLLNVSFQEISDSLIDTCFDSVGVFQELCKECCYSAGIKQTSDVTIELSKENLQEAIEKKLEAYSSRHVKALETFVEQKSRSSEAIPLYIPYYFIVVLLNSDFSEITHGFKKRALQEKIKGMHHRHADVRPSDMGYFLRTLVASQIKKGIMPPIFDFDQSTTMLKIIDSTFYFFLRNCNREDILEEIPKPEGL